MKQDILKQNENSWNALAEDFFGVTALPVLGCSIPTEDELHLLICSTEEKMLQAAANLDFELAAKLRDKLFELQGKSPDEVPEETVSLPQRRKSRKRIKYLKA